jgi:hypothetical protein
MNTPDLRERLCLAAQLDYKEWWAGAEEGYQRFIETLANGARVRRVGDAHLKFTSELQAEWVRQKLLDQNLAVKRTGNAEGEVGLSVRWSEQVQGDFLGTGKLSLFVNPYWHVEVLWEEKARKAELFYQFRDPL